MKSWFTSFRISAALDSGRKPCASLRGSRNNSEEVQNVEHEIEALDRALKQQRPRPFSAPGLHGSIMQAVRVARRLQAVPHHLAVLRWMAAPVAAALVMMGVWQTLRGPSRPPVQGRPSLAGATTALEMSTQLAQTVPYAMVAPLSDELERLNRDLDNTAQFILASLP